MDTLKTSRKAFQKEISTEKQFKECSEFTQQLAFQMRKKNLKSSIEHKNPQHQNAYIRHIVKDYIRGHDIQQLKSKFKTQKRQKNTNETNLQYRTSQDFRKAKNITSHKKINLINKHSQYSAILEQFQLQSQKINQCTCGAHHMVKSPNKFKIKDPASKYQTNYTIDTKDVKNNSRSLVQRPEITASYFSSKLQNLPQYSPKLGTIDLQSSYQNYFTTIDPKQKVKNCNYLKLSNLSFGHEQVKEYKTTYRKEFNSGIQNKYFCKTPQPFVVKQMQNLNNFGLKYHSILSNYQKQFDQKRNGKREPLKPPSLFKDLNINLVKDSSYRQKFSPDSNNKKSLKKGNIHRQKTPVVHHLSSAFVPMNGITMNSILLDSSYKKQFSKQKRESQKYYCPLGLRTSYGAISKY